jgi:hypothetical protein
MLTSVENLPTVPVVHQRLIEVLLVDALREGPELGWWLLRHILPDGDTLSETAPTVAAIRHEPMWGKRGAGLLAIDLTTADGTRLRLLIGHALSTELVSEDIDAMREEAIASGRDGLCDAAGVVALAPSRHSIHGLRFRPEVRVTYESLVGYFEQLAAKSEGETRSWNTYRRAVILRAISEQGRAARKVVAEETDRFWGGYAEIAGMFSPQLKIKAPAGGSQVPAELVVDKALSRPPAGNVRLRHDVRGKVVSLELLGWPGDIVGLAAGFERELPVDMKVRLLPGSLAGGGVQIFVRVPDLDLGRSALDQRAEVRHALACLRRLQLWYEQTRLKWAMWGGVASGLNAE